MRLNTNAVGVTLKELLQTREVGEQVVSHVLEDAPEPTPDFDAMKKAIAEPAPARNASPSGESDR